MKRFEYMRVADLKAELKARGLPVSGLKAVLIQRLNDYEETRRRDDTQKTPQKTQNGQDNPSPRADVDGARRPHAAIPDAKAAALVSSMNEMPPVGNPALAGESMEPATATVPIKNEASAALTAGAADAATPSLTSEGSELSSMTAGGAISYDSLPPTPELKSTRSKTRRASTSTAEHVSPGGSRTPGRGGNPETAAGGAESDAGAGDGTDDDDAFVTAGGRDPTTEIKLAAVAGFSAVAVSAACIWRGDGLTAGNLASLHVSLAGLAVAGRVSKLGVSGWQAYFARGMATIALAVVASEGLKQVKSSTPGAPPAMTPVEYPTEIGTTGGEAGTDVGNPAEASCDDGGLCDAVAASAAEVVSEISNAIGSQGWWQASVAWARGVKDALDDGGWVNHRFGLVEFWGWASVAAYLTLVEILPVLLRPLHPGFRSLEQLHNVLLALTSLAMLIGITYSSVISGKTRSVFSFLCSPFDEKDAVFALTSRVFFWSKAWEWFDTALLVAKGKQVSWLHYTHHASTAVLTSMNMVPTPNAAWSIVCASNSFVHAWMYGYYAFPSFGLLRRTRVWLTRAQIIQHVAVLASATYVVFQIQTGAECHNNTAPIYAGLGLYGMYLVFFALFYRRTYGKRTSRNRNEAPEIKARVKVE